MKTICIYHSRDLDGQMSAAIVKKWFVDEVHNSIDKSTLQTTKIERVKSGYDALKIVNGQEFTLTMLGWDYGDEIPDLSEYDKVIMCDVSFPAEEMIKLKTKRQSIFNPGFIYIDHHISAIKNLEIDSENTFAPKYDGIQDTNYAACELTWKYFFPNEEMPEIVRLLGMYDSFRHKCTDEEQKVLEFQWGARQCISNYEEAYQYLTGKGINNYTPKDLVIHIKHIGVFIYQYLCTEAKQVYKNTFDIKFTINTPKITLGYKFLCVNKERFNPINFGIDYHKDGYDGFACFWYSNNQWNFSLYNDNGEVDCSALAKQYGGGGHKGAAGFRVDSIERFFYNRKVEK